MVLYRINFVEIIILILLAAAIVQISNDFKVEQALQKQEELKEEQELLEELQQIQEPELSELDTLKAYLSENIEPSFGTTQPDRVQDLSIENDLALMTYISSTADPGLESFYLMGTVFITFENVTEVRIRAYNPQGDLLSAGSKFASRVGYTFDIRYFTLSEIEAVSVFECSIDSDCDDRNRCTLDSCSHSKCSNVKIIGCVLEGPTLKESTNYKSDIAITPFVELQLHRPRSVYSLERGVLIISGEVKNAGDVKTNVNVTITLLDADEIVVSFHSITPDPEIVFPEGTSEYELTLMDGEDIVYYSVAVVPIEE